MKFPLTVAIVALTLTLTSTSWGQDAEPSADSASAQSESAAALEAIRKTEATFKAAFDKGDAEALAGHWTPNGEYIAEDGTRLQGREAIAGAYKEFFEANPGATLMSHIQQLKLVSADTAIEDGISSVEPAPAGAPAKTRYTVVHVKQDGEWLMASVRDSRIETPSNYEHLADFEWLIGTWECENAGVEFEITSRWAANKNFVEQKFHSHRGGETITSGLQIIGWDPATNSVKSWAFTSDGGHAVGIWTPRESGWIAEVSGVLSDGTPTTAVNILSGLDDNAHSWRSVERTAGSFRVLDTDELILRRAADAEN